MTVKTVSNNWNVSLQIAASLLEEWSENNPKSSLHKDYLVKGVDRNGNAIITIVPETKVASLTKKLKTSVKVLHGIEKKSESSSRKLRIPEYEESLVIKLELNGGERKMETPQKQIQEVREIKGKDMIPKKNIFIASVTAGTSKSNEHIMKKSIFESSSKKNGSIETKPNVVDKVSTKSPKKSDSFKKESPKKKEMSKNSIASFFGAGKPKATTASNGIQIKSETKSPTTTDEPSPANIKPEVKSSPKLSVESSPKPMKKETASQSLKRTISQINGGSDSSDTENVSKPSTTPSTKIKPTRKRASKTSTNHETGNAKKRSRVMAIVDSDSSDEGEENDAKINNAKNVEIKKGVSTTKSVNSKGIKTEEPSNGQPGKKFKAKRIVSRSYEDEDGFISKISVLLECLFLIF